MNRRTNCRSLVVYLIMATLLAIWFVPACLAADASGATGSMRQAEHDLNLAYVAVAEAEDAGASVSALLNTLGSAGDLLSKAYAAFEAGDYDNSIMLSMDCSHSVEGIATKAANLKVDAERARSDGLLIAVAESSVGLVLLLALGLVGWKFLKRRYFGRLMDMQPQTGEEP